MSIKGGREVDEALQECEAALEKLLERQVEEGESFENYEQAVTKIVHEIARRRLEKKLQSIARGFAHRVAIEHNEDWSGWRDETLASYRRHSAGTVMYHSLFGPLHVHRYRYRERGSTMTLVPLDLAAGIVEHMTPALARSIAVATRTCRCERAKSCCWQAAYVHRRGRRSIAPRVTSARTR